MLLFEAPWHHILYVLIPKCMVHVVAVPSLCFVCNLECVFDLQDMCLQKMYSDLRAVQHAQKNIDGSPDDRVVAAGTMILKLFILYSSYVGFISSDVSRVKIMRIYKLV